MPRFAYSIVSIFHSGIVAFIISLIKLFKKNNLVLKESMTPILTFFVRTGVHLLKKISLLD